ncbi:DUF2863 family protein [Herbaspirillum sp. alder98]|uniref:DUF2863 family protein n=1 Tax=Herbaspirillum sp. alder98 TaxID=2913096 RepID=UPI001CD8644B|nr:DUF2863 family protein [Herbaspirillum sp. alder98]MCA1327015.1 DUF2863 family protein [Herbaspirillum sp. alder98]
MNKPKRPTAKPAAKPAGPARDKPRTHVATDASRRRQQNAHAASNDLDEDEERVRQLAALATAVAAGTVADDGQRVGQSDLERMIRNCLRQRDDETLYEALEQLRFEDQRGHSLLRQTVEDAADMLLLRRGERELEINAFLIPLLVRTRGGLQASRVLADGESFDTLRNSLQQAGLESERARVVLVHHLYHPEEIDAISYSELEAMNRDAFASLTDRKVMSVPAIERSMRGWPEAGFGADDEVLELRFLLGFSLKELDDPFYRIPTDEAAADAYFEQRAERFRAWSGAQSGLMRQCLTGSGEADACDLHFLYQDLFHGAKQAGNAEYRMLQMLSELEQGLAAAGAAAADARAVLAIADDAGDAILQVQLRRADAVLASASHLLDGDLQEQLFDAAESLASLGVTEFKLADGFGDDGSVLRERAWPTA